MVGSTVLEITTNTRKNYLRRLLFLSRKSLRVSFKLCWRIAFGFSLDPHWILIFWKVQLWLWEWPADQTGCEKEDLEFKHENLQQKIKRELHLIWTRKFSGKQWFMWKLFGLSLDILLFFLSFQPHCWALLLSHKIFNPWHSSVSRLPKTLWDFKKLENLR